MGKDKNTVLTIDIGGDSLKMAEFSFPSGGGMTLEKFAFAEYDTDQKDADFADLFSVVYNRLLVENNFVSTGLRIAISGQLAFTRLSKLPPLGEDKGRIEQIVEYEAKQTVPYPMNEVIWDYQLVKHTIKSEAPAGQEPEINPETGEPVAPKEPEADIDEMEALFVAVKSDLVSELAEIIQESGKDILSIEIAPTAFFNAARANQIGVTQCDMILNIGGRCSSLVFADQGRVFARTIPIAGHSVTQQISKEFNISFSDAEELKRRHGFVALGGAYEEPDSEVAATISKIARNVMTRLHGEINRSINVWRSQYGGNKPAHLYLGGGSSLMAY
ncbi:MAG: pilus assembly protein PilM, partial [Victivallaceae bacterium]